MPNNVRNIVKMKEIAKLPIFTEVQGERRFDFNKIIPMPDSLDIEMGSLEEIAIEAVMRKLSKERFAFPGKNYCTMSDKEFQEWLHGRNEEDLAKIGLQYISNKVLYGATTWYDWRYQNWGTKWNSYDNALVSEDTIEFNTAWSMPEPIMLKLSEMFPEIRIQHWWADEDVGSNAGYRVYQNGEIVEGDYVQDQSEEAYGIYIKCWGENSCLYQDENGLWQRRDCESCGGCD